MTETIKLTLGAAQLGMDYGIANRVGKLSEAEAFDFLDKAVASGIRSIDTSPHYGDSEKLIGRFIKQSNISLEVTTKLPSLADLGNHAQTELKFIVRSRLEESLERLNVSTVEHYLAHSETDFVKYGGALIDALAACRTQGLCRNIGVSVYTPHAALQAIELGVDTLQLPCNILDHRFDVAGVPDCALKNDVKLYARSAFLQGLFFLDPEQVKGWLPEAYESLLHIRNLATEYERSIAELAFVYVRDHAAIDSVVVGMEAEEQLATNSKLMQVEPISAQLRTQLASRFKDVPETVVNPSLWRKA